MVGDIIMSKDINEDMLDALKEWFSLDKDADQDRTYNTISKQLYKTTECGVMFDMEYNRVGVTGYCEGSDSELETIWLTWPFSNDQFFEAVDRADQMGVEEWNRFMGCPTCEKHWKKVWEENGIRSEGKDIPVWKDCPECGGQGMTDFL